MKKLSVILQWLSYHFPICYLQDEQDYYFINGQSVELHTFKQQVKHHKQEPIAIKKSNRINR